MKRVLVKLSTLTKWNTGAVKSAGAADGEMEMNQQSCKRAARRKEKLVELSTRAGCGGSPFGRLRIEIVIKLRVTMREKLNVV